MEAFNPTGPTVNIDAATSAPAGKLIASNANTSNYYKVFNDGTDTAFVAFGIDATAAQNAAVIPAGATTQNSYPVDGGAYILVSAPKNSYCSAITGAGTPELYVTPCYLDHK